jgi:hypothetical protein
MRGTLKTTIIRMKKQKKKEEAQLLVSAERYRVRERRNASTARCRK